MDFKKEIEEIKIENQDILTNYQIGNKINNINEILKNKSDIKTSSKKTGEFIREPEINLNLPIMQAHGEYFYKNQQCAFIYNIKTQENQASLYIYNTENEDLKVKSFQNPQPLSRKTCIALLPNNKLFCYGYVYNSGSAIIIDENFKIEVLQSGKPCELSSAIYLNNNIYCFGGYDGDGWLFLSSRFDLDKSCWFQLTSLPFPDFMCHSIIFNGNILIAGCIEINLLLYTADIDSFSRIPYSFSQNIRKILANAKERLYLIEFWNGFIYESEIGNEYAWNQIAKSTISSIPSQAYCSYNKEAIYIANYILW